MVVIGSSRPKRPAWFLLISSVTVWTALLIGLGLLYPVSLFLFFRSTLADRKPSEPFNMRGGSRNTNNNANNLAPDSSQSNNGKPVIGYAVSITGCGSDPLTEGAAVLKHSIHRSHARTNKYGYHMYAIVHPEALKCAKPLEQLGYTLEIRDVLVKVEDIEGEYLRTKISSNGCCGEKELIKLEAYTLTSHPIVVHLDLDVLVLRDMDELFDYMLTSSSTVKRQPLASFQWPDKPIPEQVNAFFTMDYNMVRPNCKYKPVQGGFLVLRPDMAVYEEFKQIVKKGDFRDGKGWGGAVGPFYGSMTFQGLIPYYYNYLHRGQSVELNRCIYNQMCDNPRTGRTVNDVVSGECRTGQEECEDCRSRSVEDVVTVHYTLCQKPWTCVPHAQDMIQHRLCRKLVREWFETRSDMERSWGRSGSGPAKYDFDENFGYCRGAQKKNYIPIAEPYGQPAEYAR